MPIDIDTLNGPQREAVVTTEGPLLVQAGAGTGKTRVRTYRSANILEQDLAAPWEILAITFTNKAAAEMRERLAQLVGTRSRGMWVSTFHSMCVRMLRADAERLGFTKNFTIYDTDDLKRLYKDIMAELNIDPKRFPVNQLMNRISQAKNDLVTPGNFDAHDPVGKGRVRKRLRAPTPSRRVRLPAILHVRAHAAGRRRAAGLHEELHHLRHGRFEAAVQGHHG